MFLQLWDYTLEEQAQQWVQKCEWKYRDFSDYKNNKYQGYIAQLLYYSSSEINIEVAVKVTTLHSITMSRDTLSHDVRGLNILGLLRQR